MCKFDVGSLILHISSSCFWFFFDCSRVRFSCFHLFYGYVRLFQMFCAVHGVFGCFRVVCVVSDRFKVNCMFSLVQCRSEVL